MKTSLLRPHKTSSRIETASMGGSYAATFVVGVLGFIVGNLALDAIKEQIHPNTTLSASQPAPNGPPQLAIQSEPRPPAVPQPAAIVPTPLASQSKPGPSAVPQTVPTGPPQLAAQSEPKPTAELLQPQEPSGKQLAQVSQQDLVTPATSPSVASGSVGPSLSPNSAIGDASAYVGKGDPNKAASRLNPKLAQAYYNRAVTYWHKGDHDRASVDFNEAILLDPTLAVAYYGRACAYWHYGCRAEAEWDFAQAKRLGYISPKPSLNGIIQMSFGSSRASTVAMNIGSSSTSVDLLCPAERNGDWPGQ